MYNHSMMKRKTEMTISYISYNRRMDLISLGYHVEDMEAEWGTEFVGQYRWMNEITDEFQDQDCDTSCSIDDAWILADQHQSSAVV